MEVSIETFKKRLQKLNVGKQPDKFHPSIYEDFRKASTLIPIFFKNGVPFVLLTLRSNKMNHLPSTVTFPGGVLDKTDLDEVETALREAYEEIGLLPSHVEVICSTPKYLLHPNFIVNTIIGLIPEDFTPDLNQEEVEIAFHLPLSRFLSSDFTVKPFEIYGKSFATYWFKDTVENREVEIWGYTAMMCLIIALTAYNKKVQSTTKDFTEINSEILLNILEDFTECTLEHHAQSKL